jgi:hypothetical protein
MCFPIRASTISPSLLAIRIKILYYYLVGGVRGGERGGEREEEREGECALRLVTMHSII